MMISAIKGCSSLPDLLNGRNVPIQGSRGSAYRFKCNRGFKRFGELRTHCIGDRWSHTHMPSCASKRKKQEITQTNFNNYSFRGNL